MLVEERLQPALQLKPEVASLNMGSMNFGLYPTLDRQKEFKHDWERPYLEGSNDCVFKNTFKDIQYRNYSVVVLNLRAPSVLLGYELGGIVGHQMLSRYRVSFDLERSVLRLNRNTQG